MSPAGEDAEGGITPTQWWQLVSAMNPFEQLPVADVTQHVIQAVQNRNGGDYAKQWYLSGSIAEISKVDPRMRAQTPDGKNGEADRRKVALAVVMAAIPGLKAAQAATAPKVVARTFTSADPLVAELANAIEKAYPGHVVGVNVPLYDAAGNLVTDADILLKNAVIQVKSGAGKGLTSQLARTQAATTLPVIGYGPALGGSVVRGILRAGGLVTRDAELLLKVVAP
jgi:hypothetical protein